MWIQIWILIILLLLILGIQAATDKMKQKGTIGSFSKAAKKAGKSTGAMATKVLNNPKASPAMKKKANFAKNVAKARKK